MLYLMARYLLLLFVVLPLAGCVSLTGRPPDFAPYSVYVEALVAEQPEAFAPFVREAMAGTVIVGDAPAPPGAQYIARLRSHPAGTHLRIERRLNEPGFYDGTQLSELYLKAVRAWEGDDRFPEPHRARYIPQASAPTCITDTTATGLAPPPDPPELEDEEETFIVVEQPPALVGGLRALQKRIRYPELARRKGIEGIVMTTFVVDEQGNVPCIDIVNGLPYGINEEVLAAVQDLEFRPGTQRGEPVKVRFSLPVKFRLR
ncbi:MAG: energy transducer TonB [Rhodothermales bacterium]